MNVKTGRPIGGVVYTDADLVRALRLAAAELPEGAPLGIKFYRRFHIEHRLPSTSTMVKRFGSWVRACIAANVPYTKDLGGYGQANHRKEFITRDECLAAIARCRDDLGKLPTAREYSSWLDEGQAGANEKSPRERGPSTSTVRKRLPNKSWLEILSLLAE
jgi:hypothetical protein